MAPTSYAILLLLLSPLLADYNLSSLQSPAGFLSIDCGSSRTSNYTDALGIVWAPDATLWPDITRWSSTSEVSPPGSAELRGFAQYQTLRYFPPTNASTSHTTPTLNQTKFCYTLPAIAGAYYLLQSTFWYGSSASTTLYATRIPGFISFWIIVDTYTASQINITLPQSSPFSHEMYIQALSGSTSVSVCFSAASDESDAPFINSLQLRPLPADLTSVAIMSSTNTALHTVARLDFGASEDGPSVISYPNDTLGRLWLAYTADTTNQTSQAVVVAGVADSPPVSVLQTSFVAPSAAGLYYNRSTHPEGSAYKYHIALYFAELDPRVNASGLRVFDVSINGKSFSKGIDVYAVVGLYAVCEIYSTVPVGPFSDYVLINLTSTAGSLFPPFIAAAEILQLVQNPMVPPTSSVDTVALEGIKSSLSDKLSRFTGDPCWPAEYKYPWVNCTAEGILPTRVVSISLSNSELVGSVPASITELDQLEQILLDGNALEGPLPVDLSNLVNLRILNLSNNKLSGAIPDALANMPRLTILDLRNNNFSGDIPLALQQKVNTGQLTFKYDGNSLLCLSSNLTCHLPPTTSSSRSTSTPLAVIGSGVGAGVGIIVILLVVYIICKKRKNHNASKAAYQAHTVNPNSGHESMDPHVVSHTKLLDAVNVAHAFTFEEITAATNNFSTVLGQGGSGFVYKGTLANGLAVAVKVLSNASKHGEQEFLNEVSLLSRVHHKNLVGLVGYCTDKKLVLVYEYMSNGSLFDCLFGDKSPAFPPLKWTQRLQILLDAAQGLEYLHHGCSSLIIHRDVKSSNILMNDALEGKMSDFGISKLNYNNTGHGELATKLIGTMGYLDPEYASTMILSRKTDIYSFGVVLFEAICGKPPLMELTGRSNVHIIEWVRAYYEQGAMEEVIDPNIGIYNVSSIWAVAEIAMACTQSEGSKRPTMSEVCNALSEALRLETSSHIIAPARTEQFLPLNPVPVR